jgi:hypothetical protein
MGLISGNLPVLRTIYNPYPLEHHGCAAWEDHVIFPVEITSCRCYHIFTSCIVKSEVRVKLYNFVNKTKGLLIINRCCRSHLQLTVRRFSRHKCLMSVQHDTRYLSRRNGTFLREKAMTCTQFQTTYEKEITRSLLVIINNVNAFIQ